MDQDEHSPRAEKRYTRLGGVPIRNTTIEALVRFVDVKQRARRQVAIAFVNHNFIVACRHLRAGAKADPDGLLLINDGVGVDIAAWLFKGRIFKENLNGTDLVPRLLDEMRTPSRLFLLGSSPEVCARARTLIHAMPRREVVGAVDGFSMWRRQQALIDEINAARPDILLVGLGNPKQETWILQNRRALNVPIILAVGALFEWMTGYRRRAPAFVRRVRLEWIYRVVIEPRRLLRRYTVDAVLFFAIVWRERDLADPPVWRSRLGQRSRQQAAFAARSITPPQPSGSD